MVVRFCKVIPCFQLWSSLVILCFQLWSSLVILCFQVWSSLLVSLWTQGQIFMDNSTQGLVVGASDKPHVFGVG
jgi:hypothetical protein